MKIIDEDQNITPEEVMQAHIAAKDRRTTAAEDRVRKSSGNWKCWSGSAKGNLTCPATPLNHPFQGGSETQAL